MRNTIAVLAMLMLLAVMAGCTTNVTIDNSVIDQSDVTQVLGCATDYGLLGEA